MATVESKAPTGLTIARAGDINNAQDTYTCKWKFGAKNYGNGQKMAYRYLYKEYQTVKGKSTLVSKDTAWTSVSIGKTDKSKAFKMAYSGFCPSNGRYLYEVQFRVKGNQTGKNSKGKTYGWSDWSKKGFTVKAPDGVTVDVEVGTWPKTTFTINATNDAASAKILTYVQYQYMLVKNCNTDKGESLNWNSATTATSKLTTTPVPITEDSGVLNDGNSYTRWFRARACGPGGITGWVYKYHTYAMPGAPTVSLKSLVDEGLTYSVKLNIDTPKSTARPVKEVRAEWLIDEPAAGLTPAPGASWTTGATIVPYDTTSGAYFKADNNIGFDECLFARAVSVYDDYESPGAAILLAKGALTAPTGLSVTPGSDSKFTVSATNNSAVTGSFLVVRFYDEDNPNGLDVGILNTSPKVIQCPEWTESANVVIGVYAAVGSYEVNPRDDGVDVYSVDALMVSDVQKSGGTVPVAPANVTAGAGAIPGTIRVTWDWTWAGASTAELSWADHIDAWESTNEPQTYSVSKARTSAWNISGLETGKTWYVRVRLVSGGDTPTYGAYSDIQEVSLASAPLVPVMDLSAGVITEDGEVTATWGYSTTDGTGQASAVIAEYDPEDSSDDPYTPIAQVTTQQTYTISAAEQGWQVGETHLLCVSVVSGSGLESDGWSAPVPVTIADNITCSIDSTTFGTITETTTDEEGNIVTNTYTALDEMPLTVVVTGAGVAGGTTLVIERAENYTIDRPYEDQQTSFAGETIYISADPVVDSGTGESTFTVTNGDLIGRLDDGAFYNLVATVQDDLGQSDTQEIPFIVAWSHQAEEPTADVEIVDTVAYLTPIAPASYVVGDVCDIYRLSIDRPELVYKGAEFGTTYVDPYPTIGEFGGYRFVTRTADGDTTTTAQTLAWYDTDEGSLNVRYNIIDFDGGTAELTYDVDISNDWQKDFEQTAYLGGSVQGDWNKAVKRSGSVNATGVEAINGDLAEEMRRLAAYPGICHVRTKDGSSYAADVQVGEKYNYASGVKTRDYSLKISRVETEELDGIPLSEWLEESE